MLSIHLPSYVLLSNHDQSINQFLLNTDITNVNANTLWIQFRDALLHLIDRHIPYKTVRKKCSLPWVTTEIRKMIRKCNRLYSMYKTFHSSEFYEHFKSLKRDIQKNLHTSYQQYISSLISYENDDSNHLHNNNKKFWTYI